jgi:hypothetical protein
VHPSKNDLSAALNLDHRLLGIGRHRVRSCRERYCDRDRISQRFELKSWDLQTFSTRWGHRFGGCQDLGWPYNGRRRSRLAYSPYGSTEEVRQRLAAERYRQWEVGREQDVQGFIDSHKPLGAAFGEMCDVVWRSVRNPFTLMNELGPQGSGYSSSSNASHQYSSAPPSCEPFFCGAISQRARSVWSRRQADACVSAHDPLRTHSVPGACVRRDGLVKAISWAGPGARALFRVNLHARRLGAMRRRAPKQVARVTCSAGRSACPRSDGHCSSHRMNVSGETREGLVAASRLLE